VRSNDVERKEHLRVIDRLRNKVRSLELQTDKPRQTLIVYDDDEDQNARLRAHEQAAAKASRKANLEDTGYVGRSSAVDYSLARRAVTADANFQKKSVKRSIPPTALRRKNSSPARARSPSPKKEKRGISNEDWEAAEKSYKNRSSQNSRGEGGGGSKSYGQRTKEVLDLKSKLARLNGISP